MSLDWRLRLLLLADQAPPAVDPTPATAREAFSSQMRLLRPIATGPGPKLPQEFELPIGTLKARLYRPAPGVLPIIMHLHGGGWVVGDLVSHQPFCRALAKATGAIVVDVEYRLAPEHHAPAAVDDAVAALHWLEAHAGELEADGSRIAVVGDSAGGHLALWAALRAPDRVRALALIYPAVSAELTTGSHLAYASGYALTAARMRWYWSQYAPGALAASTSLLKAELRGLPPTLVITAQYDVLHDEGIALIARLRQAGVAVQHLDATAVIHGYMVMQRLLPQARAGLSAISTHLRSALLLRSS